MVLGQNPALNIRNTETIEQVWKNGNDSINLTKIDKVTFSSLL